MAAAEPETTQQDGGAAQAPASTAATQEAAPAAPQSTTADGAPAPDAPEGSAATPIPENAALIPHENADTAGTHGYDGEQLQHRSAQGIADEINGVQ